MKDFRHNNFGFSLLEGLLVVVVLVLVGGAGYGIAYHRYRKANTTSISQTASPANAVTTAGATELLTTFYQQYTAASRATPPSTATMTNVIKQYGTSNLVTYASKSYNANPIVCAQAVPDKASVSNVHSTTVGALGTIRETFGIGMVNIDVVVVNQSGSLKIDSIACPANSLTEHAPGVGN